MPGHPGSFASWVNGLRPGGTLAFQVPGNFTAPSHRILAELCDTPRWRDRLAATARDTSICWNLPNISPD